MLLLHGDGRIPQRPSLTGCPEIVKNRRHGLQDGIPVRNRSPPRTAAPPRPRAPSNWSGVAGSPYHQIWPVAAAIDLDHASAGHAAHWLDWRRRHQALARWDHQRTRLARDAEIALGQLENGRCSTSQALIPK